MKLSVDNAAQQASEFLKTIPADPPRYTGRGIVICAGGIRYLTCAWVLIKLLRHLGCQLPIEIWYLGEKEKDRQWVELVEPLGVRCIDTLKVAKKFPHPRLGGWESKPFAILHSSFREVIYLDADNTTVTDPTFLFDTPEYQSTGALFWPDGPKTLPESNVWKVFGIRPRLDQDQESGQIVIDKQRSWRALCLSNWYNEHSDFFYKYIYGDKDTFRLAWRRLKQEYAMCPHPLMMQDGVLCQHDFSGQALFQHRCFAKWSLHGNRRRRGLKHESECHAFVAELRKRWNPATHLGRKANQHDHSQANSLCGQEFLCFDESDQPWPVTLCATGHMEGYRGRGGAYWWIKAGNLILANDGGQTTQRLRADSAGNWHTVWRRQNVTKIQLVSSTQQSQVRLASVIPTEFAPKSSGERSTSEA